MSTFFGGEQFIQLVKVTGTVTVSSGQVGVLYTIPTGFYGKIKFAYQGSNANDSQYYSGNSATSIYLSPPEAGTAFNTPYIQSRIDISQSSTNYLQVKQLYSPYAGLYDTYCQEGSNFTISGVGGSQVYRYELYVELYKLP